MLVYTHWCLEANLGHAPGGVRGGTTGDLEGIAACNSNVLTLVLSFLNINNFYRKLFLLKSFTDSKF